MYRLPLAQRDLRWSNIILGNNTSYSGYTIGGWGCYITSMAIAAGTTPDYMNNMLKSIRGGFAYSDGNLQDFNAWEIATAGYKYPFKFLYKSGYHWEDAFPDNEYQELIARPPNTAFLLVDNSTANGLQEHHVLVTEVVNGMPLVFDPWLGDMCSLCPRFGRTIPIALIQAVYIQYKTEINHA